MKSLREVGNQPLTWRQAEEGKASWELRAGDEVVGALAFRNPAGDGTLAFAESADGRWSFKRVGVFSPTVTVRAEGTDTDAATITPRVGKSVAAFADGRVVHFIRTHFWRNEFAFTQSDGKPFLAFQEAGTRVEIAPGAETRPDTTLLALLGCYLLLLYGRDAEAVAYSVLVFGS